MGKKKNKQTADQLHKKRKRQEKLMNPFEVKINRQKHDVLGRKFTKFEKGMPGISRAKATKRRRATLLKEYEHQFRKNQFVDKRFGEQDASLSLEEKMMKRYAMERSRNMCKNKFQLNEEEELTHYGQSLAEIEKFDEPVISDEDEDDEERRAAAKLVADEHFGGFMRRKKLEDEKKSWKERMEEMIKESKKKKHERQMEKEETVTMTEQLDEQWKELHSLVRKSKGKVEEDSKRLLDDYDIAVRSLQFEIKGQATDKFKSEEELAREEKDRLERLEADRLRRMKGLSAEETQPQHKSADDLDDGFTLEQDFDYVSYKDGLLNKEADNDLDNDEKCGPIGSSVESDLSEGEELEVSAEELSCEGEDDDSSNNEEDAEDFESNHDKKEASTEKAKIKKQDKGNLKKNENKVDDYDEDDHDSDNNNDDDEDNSSDMENKFEDLETDEEEISAKEIENMSKKSLETNFKGRKLMLEEARKELPYTFKAPETYEELLGLLEGHSMEEQLTIIARIRKCHHPSLAEGNKQKLETFQSHLVQLYCDVCLQDSPQLADRLVSHLYELTQMSPDNTASLIVGQLMERQAEFAHICEKKAGRGLYPGLDTLLLFKLVSVLFPASDFHHPVTTPSLLFMCQILGQSPVNNERDVVAGLLLCSICLEYVSLSKRYLPEVINFLHGLLFYAADKSQKIEFVVPPFKPVGNNINLLHLEESADSYTIEKWSLSEMFAPVVNEIAYKNDRFRVRVLYHCVKLLSEFTLIYRDMVAFREIFQPVLYMCCKLPVHLFPVQLQALVREFTSSCEESSGRSRKPLVMQKKKPKPLKMFEPKVEEKFDGKKKGKRGTKEFNKKQKLLHKYKKEMKGAVRELKKDTKFLARQKLQEMMERDSQRKRKVKEIMGGLAQQEGDYKKMKRGFKPE